LSKTRVGKNGNAFILDDKGNYWGSKTQQARLGLKNQQDLKRLIQKSTRDAGRQVDPEIVQALIKVLQIDLTEQA